MDAQSIELAIGARVMLTKNADTANGLVNAMMGTVVNCYPPMKDDLSVSALKPLFVLVQMDGADG